MATNQQPSAPLTSSWDLGGIKDEIVDEIHASRARYAEQFDYDIALMFQDLQAKEAVNTAPRARFRPLEPKAKVFNNSDHE